MEKYIRNGEIILGEHLPVITREREYIFMFVTVRGEIERIAIEFETSKNINDYYDSDSEFKEAIHSCIWKMLRGDLGDMKEMVCLLNNRLQDKTKTFIGTYNLGIKTEHGNKIVVNNSPKELKVYFLRESLEEKTFLKRAVELKKGLFG